MRNRTGRDRIGGDPVGGDPIGGPRMDRSPDEVAGTVRSMVRHIAKLDRPVADDAPLLGSVLDSLGVLQLVSDLEDGFDLTFDEDEMTPGHFRTLADIVRLVVAKLSVR